MSVCIIMMTAKYARKRFGNRNRPEKEVSAVTVVINLCFFHDHLKLVVVPSEEKMNKRRRKRRNEGKQRF
jgi:hypothetical protein